MTKSRKFSLQSAGVAYNLEIGFEPTTITVWNRTKWATDATKVMFFWHKGMAAGTALSEICDDAGVNRAIEATNGFTLISASSVNNAQEVITLVTQANPAVVTVGSTTGWLAGHTVRIKAVVGMTELNGNLYKIKSILGATTFELELDSSSFTGYASGGVAYNVSENIKDSGYYGVTLGTTVICADNDLLEIECQGADDYTSLGDIA